MTTNNNNKHSLNINDITGEEVPVPQPHLSVSGMQDEPVQPEYQHTQAVDDGYHQYDQVVDPPIEPAVAIEHQSPTPTPVHEVLESQPVIDQPMDISSQPEPALVEQPVVPTIQLRTDRVYRAPEAVAPHEQAESEGEETVMTENREYEQPATQPENNHHNTQIEVDHDTAQDQSSHQEHATAPIINLHPGAGAKAEVNTSVASVPELAPVAGVESGIETVVATEPNLAPAVAPAVEQPQAEAPVMATPPKTPKLLQTIKKTFSKSTSQEKQKQPKQAHPKSRLRVAGYGLLSFALLLVVLNIQVVSQQIGYFLHPPKANQNLTLQDPGNAQQASTAAIVGPENLIIIPKVNVSAPIVFAGSNAEAAVLKDLESGVVHYADTANPGTKGNAVIFGHSSNDWWEPGNYKFVFALLEKLSVGDQIQINYSSRKYVYQVSETKVVQPSEVSVLNPTPDNTLTLITCTPPGTAWRRLIVTAKQIEPAQESTTPKLTNTPKASQSKTAVAVVKPKALPSNAPTIGMQISKFFSGLVGFFTPKPSPQPVPVVPSAPHLPEVS